MPKKINRKAVEWFLNSELPELREKKFLPPESLDALERYYRELASQPGNVVRTVIISLFCIGALFVMLGISLIIAHNWDDFPDSVRLAMGFTPLGAGVLFGFYALWKEKGALWREPAAVIYGIGTAAALAVTTQVYCLGGELRSFLLTWLCLLIPVPLIFRSFGALILTLAVTVCWTGCDVSSRPLNLWLDAGLPLIPGAMLIALMIRKADTLTGGWCRCLLVPYAMLYCLPFLCFQWNDHVFLPCLWFFITGALFVLGCRINTDRPFGFFRNPLPAAGFAGAYFVLMFLCSRTTVRTLCGFHAEYHLPCCAAMLLPVAGILYCALKKPRHPLLLLPLLPAAALLLTRGSAAAGLVMTGVTLILMTVLFILAVKRNSLAALNAAMLLIIGLIFVWFMEQGVSILTRGTVFIITGLLFAGVNILILKRRGKGGSSHA